MCKSNPAVSLTLFSIMQSPFNRNERLNLPLIINLITLTGNLNLEKEEENCTKEKFIDYLENMSINGILDLNLSLKKPRTYVKKTLRVFVLAIQWIFWSLPVNGNSMQNLRPLTQMLCALWTFVLLLLL